MLESQYQHQLIKKIRDEFPGAVVIKNDTAYIQGFPDLTVFFEDRWAVLEVKSSEKAPDQPNQHYYIGMLNHMSFAAFIYPENEEQVFNGLQRTFFSDRPARLSWGEQLPLDQL